MAKKKKEKIYGPVFIVLIVALIISLVSLFFSIFEIESYKTVIANGTLESSLVSVKNILSIDGFQYIIKNIILSFRNFEPLVLLIISLFGISICERSGLFNALFAPLKKIKFSLIIFLTLLLGIASTIIGDYSYIFLLPLIGAVYKCLEKNPILGIMIVFIGITLGYGTGFIFNYNDHLLGLLTQAAASLDVDDNYKYSLLTDSYIRLISSIALAYFGTIIIEKLLVPKFTKKYLYEEEPLLVNKKAKKYTIISFLAIVVTITYMILPINLPLAGILLDSSQTRYIEQLFGSNSPFGSGLVFIITLILIGCGYIYGKVSKNIKSGHDFSIGLAKSFENLGFLFVLMFSVSIVTLVINYTNIGVVVGSKLIEFMGDFQFSGIPLIITFIIFVIIMSILIPGTYEKWQLISPTIIPLFMQSNITPGFTQFIFKVADGIGKCINPIFIYFIIMLAFLEKYQVDDKKQISVFGTYKMMLPTIVLLSLISIAIILLWYLIGLPIGVGISSTL